MSKKIYQMITDQIIEKLETGVIPWKKDWSLSFAADGSAPLNYITKKAYRGFNHIWLSCQPYSCPYWLTFKQVKSKKGQVKKGEKSTIIIFWKFNEKKYTDKETGEIKKESIPMLRYYNVFNLEQTTLYKPAEDFVSKTEDEKIEACENILNDYTDCPEILTGYNPVYMPTKDKIGMPIKSDFQNLVHYYAALFHEMGHSTMHPTRLDRSTGSKHLPYAKEELVAELTASFLCQKAGIATNTIDNQASYIEGWLQALKNDVKMVISASTLAQKSADYILGEYKAEAYKTAA